MPKHNKNQYSLQYEYNTYKKTVSEPLTYKEHKKVLDLWGDIVTDYLLLGKDVRLHKGLSVLGVRKKVKRTYVDRKASKISGKLVIKPNTHSGFYGAYIYWKKNYVTCSAKGWVFKPSRALSRRLGEVMKEHRGHTRFSQRAVVTSSKKHAKAVYKQKVLKL